MVETGLARGRLLSPLLSKVTRLTVASLSGQGFVMEDQNGDVVASESKLASEVMNVASWGCNLREMHALYSAAPSGRNVSRR